MTSAYIGTIARESLVTDANIPAQAALVVRETLVWDKPSAFTITGLSCVQIPPLTDDRLSLRWSDDGGASWGNPTLQSIGDIGQYQTSIQFRRLGQARSRIIELSWSGAMATALNGIFIDIVASET